MSSSNDEDAVDEAMMRHRQCANLDGRPLAVYRFKYRSNGMMAGQTPLFIPHFLFIHWELAADWLLLRASPTDGSDKQARSSRQCLATARAHPTERSIRD